MPYCMYLRKSRADMDAESRGEGETLARHRKALLELAQRQGLTIERIYQEVVSGDSIASRPEMQLLLEDVHARKWSGVLCMEVERLARGDTIDQGIVAEAFKYSDTRIITPVKTYDPQNDMDTEYFEFALFMSRRELKTITRRMQAGRVASVKEGKYAGSVAPYGYVRVKIPNDKGYTLAVDPERAPIVKMVFEWAAHGCDGKYAGGATIASKLNDMGIKTNNGKSWTQERVSKMICNPVYVGKVQWQQRTQVQAMQDGQRLKKRNLSPDKHIVVRGLHEPLVDEDTFRLAGERAKSHRIVPAKKLFPVANPLAGLLVCAVCGKAMRYVCRTPDSAYAPILRCITPGCPTVGIAAPIVERAVMDALEGWLELCATPAPAPRPHTAEKEANEAIRAQLMSQIRTLETQQSNLHDLLEQGVYSTETFLTRSTDINSRLSALRASLDATKDETPEDPSASIRSLERDIRTVLNAYDVTASAGYRNDLLKTIISKILYSKTKKGQRTVDPANLLEIKLFPSVSSSQS